MNILEDLWYGNIYPSERNVEKGSEYAEALCKLVEEQGKLSPEIHKSIQKYAQAQMEATMLAERDAFMAGFRLGVQLVVAGLGK